MILCEFSTTARSALNGARSRCTQIPGFVLLLVLDLHDMLLLLPGGHDLDLVRGELDVGSGHGWSVSFATNAVLGEGRGRERRSGRRSISKGGLLVSCVLLLLCVGGGLGVVCMHLRGSRGWLFFLGVIALLVSKKKSPAGRCSGPWGKVSSS